jgi:hypothetical protein
VGACDGRTQSTRACLFFSFTPNPSPKKPKKLKPNTLFFFFSKNSCINPRQPAGKGRKKKKTLVLTLGNPLKKGGNFLISLNLGISPGQPAEKGWKRAKKKKNLGINPGQNAGPQFQDLDLDFRT